MAAPVPLLSSAGTGAGAGAGASVSIGARIIATTGGVAALQLRPDEADVFLPAAYLHAVPPAPSAIAHAARHVWVCVFAALMAAATGDEADAIARARALEAAIYRAARRGHAVAPALVPTALERAHAESVEYMDACRRMQAALSLNAAYLVATYDDVTLLPQLDAAHMEVGTPAAAYKERKAHEAMLAKRVLEDGGAKKVVEGIIKCSFCGSFDVDTDFKQVRSSDEGMDLFVACNACGKKRQYKG